MLKTATHLPGNAASDDQFQTMALRAELAARIDQILQADGVVQTAIPRFRLGKVTHVPHPVHTVYEPALCVIAQGSKRVLLGNEVYVYDASHYLVFAQNLPVSGQVVDASAALPHMALRLDFDVKEVAALAMELNMAGQATAHKVERGIYTGELTSALLSPLLRLVKLLEQPEDIPVLAPMLTREILYRLLKAPAGWRLAQLSMAESNSSRIAQTIELLRRRFHEPLAMADLAREAHWSVSALHHHFKAVTAMSPLQFQKQLRLQEARRVMLAEGVDAATAGHRVGYDSQSQFSREYSRFFGSPPVRDIKRLREQRVVGMSG